MVFSADVALVVVVVIVVVDSVVVDAPVGLDDAVDAPVAADAVEEVTTADVIGAGVTAGQFEEGRLLHEHFVGAVEQIFTEKLSERPQKKTKLTKQVTSSSHTASSVEFGTDPVSRLFFKTLSNRLVNNNNQHDLRTHNNRSSSNLLISLGIVPSS
jgi:hypothetical protein